MPRPQQAAEGHPVPEGCMALGVLAVGWREPGETLPNPRSTVHVWNGQGLGRAQHLALWVPGPLSLTAAPEPLRLTLGEVVLGSGFRVMLALDLHSWTPKASLG